MTADVARCLQIYRKSSPVDHTWRPAPYTARWSIAHEAASRGPSASAYILVVKRPCCGRAVRICASVQLVSHDKQEALLLQRDSARHLSVEIQQLQNISLENSIVWHYLRDSTFSRFHTILECDRHTHRQTERHTTTAYTALSIASRGKNRPYCTAHQL